MRECERSSVRLLNVSVELPADQTRARLHHHDVSDEHDQRNNERQRQHPYQKVRDDQPATQSPEHMLNDPPRSTVDKVSERNECERRGEVKYHLEPRTAEEHPSAVKTQSINQTAIPSDIAFPIRVAGKRLVRKFGLGDCRSMGSGITTTGFHNLS
jgi:hypothetical protein